jgi:hypothetical protein
MLDFFLMATAGTSFQPRHDSDSCYFSAYAKCKAHFIMVLKITRETPNYEKGKTLMIAKFLQIDYNPPPYRAE